MKTSVLNDLLKYCRANADKHPEKENFLHWSFLVDGNAIISRGVNRSIEPPVYYGYHAVKKEKGETFFPKWHSELDAISRCKRYMGGAVMVNVRLNKGKETRLSMPCASCRRMLRVLNIKKTFFSIEGEAWGELKL